MGLKERSARWIALMGAMCLIACEGNVMGGPAGPGAGPSGGGAMNGGIGGGPSGGAPVACASDEVVSGGAPMRRLSNTEYLNTLRDLFPSARVTLPELPDDTAVGGFENDALSLGASEVQVARWEDIAWRYAEAVTRDARSLGAFLPCASGATTPLSEERCGEEFIRDFGLRALRRPLESDERDRYSAFFEAQRREIDFRAAVHLTLMAMLQAPAFLYRLELPRGTSEELDSFEVATRLSYFLWETTPDKTLLDAAGASGLDEAREIETHARRMLEDPRARAAVTDFHRQWLDFDRILDAEHARRVPEAFPTWNETLRAAIHEEQERFVESTLFDGAGTLSALLTSRSTWVNRALAELYGVAGPSDDETWIQVELPEGERSGLLTRAGFLAAHAHAANGSPPLRGVFITERLLCEARPSPPPNANLSPPTSAPGSGPKTNRELFEERTAPAQCQGCHVRMDGFGFGLEHYDAIGAFREVDQGLPVDASGNVLGTDVDGPFVGGVELSRVLAESERVEACATRNWVRYALGRAPDRADACFIDRLSSSFAATGGNVRELLVSIATSPEFRYRGAAQE